MTDSNYYLRLTQFASALPTLLDGKIGVELREKDLRNPYFLRSELQKMSLQIYEDAGLTPNSIDSHEEIINPLKFTEGKHFTIYSKDKISLKPAGKARLVIRIKSLLHYFSQATNPTRSLTRRQKFDILYDFLKPESETGKELDDTLILGLQLAVANIGHIKDIFESYYSQTTFDLFLKRLTLTNFNEFCEKDKSKCYTRTR